MTKSRVTSTYLSCSMIPAMKPTHIPPRMARFFLLTLVAILALSIRLGRCLRGSLARFKFRQANNSTATLMSACMRVSTQVCTEIESIVNRPEAEA